MDDRFEHRPERAPRKPPDRFPPRHQSPKVEDGQDFFTLTEKHGRPFGPFDRERQLPYAK
jgi:hypothetical protein